jgi:hypothetical protein
LLILPVSAHLNSAPSGTVPGTGCDARLARPSRGGI